MEKKQCSVCSADVYIGFNYGVLSCSACAQFFRSAICSEDPYSGKCGNPGNCSLRRGPDTRSRICSDCRLIACLRLGMDPKYGRKGNRRREHVEQRDFNPMDKEEIIKILRACRPGYSESNMKKKQCSVCSADTDVWFQYGVLSCNACAIFFRKAICSEDPYSGTCENPGNCPLRRGQDINSPICSDCRMIACLRLGMDPIYGKKGNRRRELAEKRDFNPNDKKKIMDILRACSARYSKSTEAEDPAGQQAQREQDDIDDMLEEAEQCLVCASENDVNVHYGVQTCHSCANFFRNACDGLCYEGKCEKPGECQLYLSPDEPPLCQDCQLIECLHLGMDPKYGESGTHYRQEVESRSFNPKNKDEIMRYLKTCHDGFGFSKASENCQDPSLIPQTSLEPTPYVPQEDEEPETKRGRIE